MRACNRIESGITSANVQPLAWLGMTTDRSPFTITARKVKLPSFSHRMPYVDDSSSVHTWCMNIRHLLIYSSFVFACRTRQGEPLS